MLVAGLAPEGKTENVSSLVRTLRDYARLIEPWANAVARYMLADVERKNRSMWRRQSNIISRELRNEIESAPTGAVLRQLQVEQVQLIQSVPLQAAERIHVLATESTITGRRAEEVAKLILETENVSASRARLIARTEVSRAAANLVQARATWAGSEGYIWRTSNDADVRDSHSRMEGKYVQWARPPTLDKMVGHAGCLPNCRCFAEPLFPQMQ